MVQSAQVPAISIRPINEDDLELLFAWRSDLEVIMYMPSLPRVPTWEEHMRWWKRGAEHHDWMVSMSDQDGVRRVGQTHFWPSTGEIGLIIGDKSTWGKGIGTEALKITIDYPIIQDYLKEHDFIWTVAHPENERSQRLFTRVGFVKVGEGRNGQVRLEYRKE